MTTSDDKTSERRHTCPHSGCGSVIGHCHALQNFTTHGRQHGPTPHHHAAILITTTTTRTTTSASSHKHSNSEDTQNMTEIDLFNGERPSPNHAPHLISVAPAERRGLLAFLAIVPEVTDPYAYKRSTKWGITAVTAIATAAAPLGSSIFYPALNSVADEFHSPPTIANLSVAMYVVAMAVFPLWWSALSEQLGRRTVYLVSFALFALFAAASALSPTIGVLVATRIAVGGASASVQAVGAGTIADVWESHERGRAMSIFFLGPLLGPLLAPVVGGAVAQAFGWRWTMWFLAIYGAVVVIMLALFLPETLPRKTTATKESRSGSEQQQPGRARLIPAVKHVLLDPLRILLHLRFPSVLITVMLSAIAFGSLFVINVALQQQFSQPPYSYPQFVVGLLYIPSGLGYILGSAIGGRWLDAIMTREAIRAGRYDEKGKLIYLPEDRLRENAWIAVTLYPIGMLLFGWTLQYGVMWMAPAIGAFIFGFASMLVFNATTTMLTELIRHRRSAGVAVYNFFRNMLACVGVVVAAPWVTAVGPGWVMTTLALFCLVVSVGGVYLLRHRASKWRVGMETDV